MRPSLHRFPVAAGLAVVAAVALAGCSSSSSATQPVSGASSGSASGPAASMVAVARAAIAPYEGHPSAFPVTQTLASRPAPGSRFVYLQCATPVCAEFGELLLAPTKALGVKLTVINSGSSATSTQAAAATAIADKPAAVLISAVDPQLFGGALHRLDAAGVAVTGVGIINGKPYGVQETVGGSASTDLAGQLMADWVVAQKGANANVVFFGTPELSFSGPMQAGFGATMTKLCPTCHVSFQPISVATFGSTAPSSVVSYLQAHPSTNTAVFATMEAATGLAAALKDASSKVTTVGFAPSPSNLQDIKDGGLTAGLGLDSSVQEWAQVNATARLLAHQPVDPSNLNVDLQFLTRNDVTQADTKTGWTGYPNVAQRFATLWPSS
jgi:ribose transport system substrate-binding protein